MNRLFFGLLRIAIGQQSELPVIPSVNQWHDLYEFACKQTLLGVLFPAIEKLPEKQRPPKDILLKWFVAKENIVRSNRLLNIRAAETIKYFHNEGFQCCILKGQGIATLYPNPLLRMPGDIDLWLDGDREVIYEFAKQRFGFHGLTFRHIHYPLYKDVEVEVHVIPINLLSPIRNYFLKQYFRSFANIQYDNIVELPENVGQIRVPTVEFNLLYILLHIYEHFLGEGVGLRQVLDYYYVLHQSTDEDVKYRVVYMLKKLKMLRFASAMMWVQKKVFGLEDKYLLLEPDEIEGRFLLSEVMQAGNFGKYDIRIDYKIEKNNLIRFYKSILHNRRLLLRYPHEMIWDIPFRVWHFFWRKWIMVKGTLQCG